MSADEGLTPSEQRVLDVMDPSDHPGDWELLWESAEHDDEPGDQNASSARVAHGYWSLGPTVGGRWSVELIEQDEDLVEDPTGGAHLGDFPSEAAAKAAAQAYEDGGVT
jgi:hypothetical protein